MAVTGFEGFEVPGEKYTAISPTPITGSGIQDVFIAEDRFAILATESGIDVVDLQCGAVISSAIISGTEVLSVAAEYTTTTGHLYIGTSTSGVLAARWKPLRAPGTDFTDKISPLYSTTSTLAITDNRINDMAVLPFKILISTGSGIDFIYTPTTEVHQIASRLLESGSNACQMTTLNEAYWTVINSGVEANYDLLSTTGIGIIGVDAEYNTSVSGLLPTHFVNDLAVSAGPPNVINVATISGDFLIDEVQGAEFSASTKFLNKGFDVVSVDFSDGATFETTGTKYVTTTGIVTVFGLVDDAVSGTHHQDILIDDKFIRENTRDQAVITGTNTVIRTTSLA